MIGKILFFAFISGIATYYKQHRRRAVRVG